jgi:hypothetical protein
LKHDIAAAQKEIIKEKVDRALISQRGVIEGHIAELFPAFRKTKINPADLCALIPTAPVDFVVMEGLFRKEVTQITFLDVKKGGAYLSPVQRSIRDTIKEGNVDFKMIRVNFENIKGNAIEERFIRNKEKMEVGEYNKLAEKLLSVPEWYKAQNQQTKRERKLDMEIVARDNLPKNLTDREIEEIIRRAQILQEKMEKEDDY